LKEVEGNTNFYVLDQKVDIKYMVIKRTFRQIVKLCT